MRKKCIKEKNLVLFYYKELEEEKKRKIEEHLKECSICLKEYKNIKNFLERIKISSPKIREQELDKILNQIQKVFFNWWEDFKYTLRDFLFNLKISLKFYLKPVPVIAFLLILFLFYPLIKNYFSYRNFEIFQIEAKLSIEAQDLSIFDFYDEGLFE
jgi:hypothetical protein